MGTREQGSERLCVRDMTAARVCVGAAEEKNCGKQMEEEESDAGRLLKAVASNVNLHMLSEVPCLRWCVCVCDNSCTN